MISSSDRYAALLEVLQAIVAVQDFDSLVRSLRPILHSVVEFEVFDLWIFTSEHDKPRIVLSGRPPKCLDRIRVEEANLDVFRSQQPTVISLENTKQRYPNTAANILESVPEAKSYCAVPLSTARDRLGVMFSISSHEDAYGQEDVKFIQNFANCLAVAIENSLTYERICASQKYIEAERDHLRMLMEVTNATVAKLDINSLLVKLQELLYSVVGAECIAFYSYDEAQGSLRLESSYMSSQFDGLTPLYQTECPSDQSVVARQDPVIACGPDWQGLAEKVPPVAPFATAGFLTSCVLPLFVHGEFLGFVITGGHKTDEAGPQKIDLIREIAKQISVAIDNIRAYRQVSDLKDQIANEKLYLEDEIRLDHNFEEILGESAALKKVLAQVEKVAPTDSSVLIMGETGTGKELIARAIHNLSKRRNHTLVKLNCAAIPASLLESELFGYEKGAFTGALAQRTGRLELANEGTLFLDEIGEMSADMQPKLLRALQEREFERVGGSRSIHVDFRLITATNRNLEELVASGQFRSDLFYRLNVFPIIMPPLRKRREDIPMLVRHFTQKYSRKTARNIEYIPTETMALLTKMNWPGNIRELENVIERAVILSPGSALEIRPENVPQSATSSSSFLTSRTPQNLLEGNSDFVERENIFRALLNSNGIVSGPHGAAQKLGMNASALFSKMLVLGISYDDTQLGQIDGVQRETAHTSDERAIARAQLTRVLNETNWVIGGSRGAAARLGLKRTTLLARMARLGITREFDRQE